MKAFFSSFFGAMVGVIIAMVLCTLIFVVSLAGIFDGAFEEMKDRPFKVKENSILVVKLNSPISERSSKNPFDGFNFGDFGKSDAIGLDQIVDNFKKAKNDENIKGVYLNLTGVAGGIATLEVIRKAMLDFKSGGKFIYAYAEMYDQKSYYLASVSDKIYLNPQGGMEFKGLSAQIMFYKKALEKLNVEVQIFRHGRFKSAIEPYMLDKMSESNRLQTEVFLGSIWGHMLDRISAARKVSVDELNIIANDLKIQSAQDAVDNKLVDELKYEDEVMSIFRTKLGIKETEKINFVKFAQYTKSRDKSEKKSDGKDGKIAVIYAVGSIESGEGDDKTIGSDRIAKAIREARLDSTIKAIVLRVNSPGGSALASDVMWREVLLAKKSKPVIVSMGDVAASGGYYISCAADRIFAEPNTITGSIGVFGMMPNAQKLFSEKLGIIIDTVNTNKHSDMGTLYRPVSEMERALVQKGVEDVYDVFISRVAEGRGMTKAQVDSIGQGRVWTGKDALGIKLVDELGGLENALAYAAKMAKITDYEVESLPKQKDPFENLFKGMSDDAEEKVLGKKLGEQYKYIQHAKSIMEMKGIQARLPFEFIIY